MHRRIGLNYLTSRRMSGKSPYSISKAEKKCKLLSCLSVQATLKLTSLGLSCAKLAEVQKVVNSVILDDRKYIQNQGLAENISKT